MTSHDKKVLGVALVGLLVLAGLVVFYFNVVRAPGGWSLTRPMDNTFGDQHLKTTVALLELYKLRHGSYPARLADLDFLGNWDEIALRSVAYYPNADRSAYYLEVTTGWVGRPGLTYPPEFWGGTGFREALKPR